MFEGFGRFPERILNLPEQPQLHNASPSPTSLTVELDAAIMASPELSARLRFLNDAAHLLATSAPETSRHLMSRQHLLLSDSNLDHVEDQKPRACWACGTIMILGWNGTFEDPRASRKSTLRGKALKKKAMVYTCDCCSRKTRFPIPPPPKISRSKSASSKAMPVSASTSSNKPQPVGSPASSQLSNPSSKKRAKSRKQGSLSAILAKQKASQGASGSGFGLDLMDFMNNG